jgi:hypothetical protein
LASFLGYRTYWFSLDVLYKLYVQSSGLAGCRVGGQIVSATQAEDPLSFARADLLARYPGDECHPEDHLFFDRKNFWLPRELIRDVRVSSRRSFWAGATTNSGSVRLRLRSARTWRFLLLGRQEPAAIERIFSSAGYWVI